MPRRVLSKDLTSSIQHLPSAPPHNASSPRCRKAHRGLQHCIQCALPGTMQCKKSAKHDKESRARFMETKRRGVEGVRPAYTRPRESPSMMSWVYGQTKGGVAEAKPSHAQPNVEKPIVRGGRRGAQRKRDQPVLNPKPRSPGS